MEPVVFEFLCGVGEEIEIQDESCWLWVLRLIHIAVGQSISIRGELRLYLTCPGVTSEHLLGASPSCRDLG
jgi:hypothetical protein